MFQFDRPRSIVRIARILFIAGTLTVGTFAQPPQSGDQAKPAVITPQQLSTSFAPAAISSMSSLTAGSERVRCSIR